MRKLINLNPTKGITLIELIISLMILLIVLAMGYQTLDFAHQSFEKGEKQWIAQKEVQKITDWLDTHLKNSYQLLIYDNNGSYTESTTFDSDDEYIYIYQADSRIFFRNSKATKSELLADIPINIEFKAENANSSTPKKALDYSVYIKKDDGVTDEFKLDSTIHFANMLRSQGVNRIYGTVQSGTTSTGNMIKFQNDTEDLASITISTNSFCFIATAAYGTPDDAPVMILRQFRDKFLLTNPIGSKFVEFYYKHSPPIAKYIENKPIMKFIICLLLSPIVMIALILLVPQVLICLGYVCFPILLFRRKMKASIIKL